MLFVLFIYIKSNKMLLNKINKNFIVNILYITININFDSLN